MDIHACDAEPALPRSRPYQLPLSALISRNITNLLAAAKNSGTTHLANGAYRLQPTEWAIGVAAGEAAHEALTAKIPLRALVEDPIRLHRLQLDLIDLGQPLVWFDDVPLTSPEFESIQATSILGLLPLRDGTLHFSTDETVSGGEVKAALQRLVLSDAPQLEIEDNAPVVWEELTRFKNGAEQRRGLVRRGEFVSVVV